MRRALLIAVFAACLITCLSSSSPHAAAVTATETRGLWVVRTSLTSREDIASVVRAAERGGFNTLIVQVRGRGDALYNSAIEPRSAELDGKPAAFDPLAVTLDLAHRAGLRVHAWIAVNLVSSSVTLPQSTTHVVRRHPEWLMVPAPLAKSLRGVAPSSSAYVTRIAEWSREKSDQVEGLFLSPVSSSARQYTVSVVRELVAKYAVDGVHFDYVRYPSDAFDYSAPTLAAFRDTRAASVAASERTRLDQRARTEPAAWADAFPREWEAFRRERLTWLVHALTAAARAARPRVSVSAAVVPRPDEAKARRLQDWPRWAAAGDLDAVCPMAYVTDDREFSSLVSRVREAAGRVPVWAGIGAFRLSSNETANQIRAARGAGAAGMVLFSYDSVSGPAGAEYLDDVRAAFGQRVP